MGLEEEAWSLAHLPLPSGPVTGLGGDLGCSLNGASVVRESGVGAGSQKQVALVLGPWAFLSDTWVPSSV